MPLQKGRPSLFHSELYLYTGIRRHLPFTAFSAHFLYSTVQPSAKQPRLHHVSIKKLFQNPMPCDPKFF
jgi:hypothetical protein